MPWWITGRDPAWGEFERLRREMDSLFSTFSRERPPSSLWRESRLFPPLNVVEKDDAYIVTAEIPGMKSEDLEIRIEGDTMTLKASANRWSWRPMKATTAKKGPRECSREASPCRETWIPRT